jgi:hypothetical protein
MHQVWHKLASAALADDEWRAGQPVQISTTGNSIGGELVRMQTPLLEIERCVVLLCFELKKFLVLYMCVLSAAGPTRSAHRAVKKVSFDMIKMGFAVSKL